MEANFPFYNTLIPYKVLEYDGISYTVCKDFNHISRYRGLRQTAHNPDISSKRFTTLEIPNPFESHTDVTVYEVPTVEENRLDLISYKFFGTASYSWVIAYFNQIEDGFTVRPGQKLYIPKSFSSLFGDGELLQSIPATQLNLGEE